MVAVLASDCKIQNYRKGEEEMIVEKRVGCKVPGCPHEHEAHGYCNGHYIQWRKFGKIKRNKLMRDPNRFVRDGDFYKIELLNAEGNLVGEALIDVEDYEKCKEIKWHLGAQGYAQNIRKRIKLQHLVWGEKVLLDHKDRNRLDCRKSNLRPCTMVENNQNQGLSCKNTSGYVGVHWHRRARKWAASIGIKRGIRKRVMHLGLFTNLVEAAKARDVVAIKLFGDFAFLNFPKEVP